MPSPTLTARHSHSASDIFSPASRQTSHALSVSHSICEIPTPPTLVQTICNRTEPLLSDPHRKLFEPGCGDGAFLVEALKRRLAHAKTPFDILIAVSNLYGLDISPHHVKNTRENLRTILENYLTTDLSTPLDYRFWPLIELFLSKNLLVADFLSMPLTFIDWQPTSPYIFKARPIQLGAA